METITSRVYNPADFSEGQLLWILHEAGLTDREFKWPINDSVMRRRLVSYWRGYYESGGEKPQSVLKFISGRETLIIEPTDGTETIPTSEGVFGEIDGNFKRWGADDGSYPTPPTTVAVYEVICNATFHQMFSCNTNTVTLCLTQSQILGFVKKYSEWLHQDGSPTFFLFKSSGELFVASLTLYYRLGLKVVVNRFGSIHEFRSAFRPRVVFPQL